MSQAFHLSVDDRRLATLTFDLPGRGANIFNRAVLAELEPLIAELAERQDIGCLVLLSGKEDIFIAGADVDAITTVTDPIEAEAGSRAGHRIFSAWEALPFPTVAAIRGTCLGGGLELSLASDYIVVSDRTELRIGLPEVRLGIVPGWGGCVRLPRRIGIAAALDLILTGRGIIGKKALKLGLADALVPDAGFGHLVRDFALAHIDKPARRAAAKDLKSVLLERNPIGRRVLFDQARKQTLAKTGGHYPAPLRAIEIVKIGVDQGPTAGFDAEARAIGELATGAVAKNLLHVFQLMEASKNTRPAGDIRPIRQAAVLGAGTMGGGIAQLIASRLGVPVRIKDIAHPPLAHAMQHAAKLFGKQVQRRRLSRPAAAERMALLRPTLDYDGFGRTDLVIEAIVEKMEVKQHVFAETAEATPEDAILASNTSSLSIDGIGEKTPHRERVVGMHFFNPVDKMPLVEVIVGASTGDDAVATIVDLTKKLGKTPVVVQDGPGFLVNRILAFYSNEAMWLLEEGHKIEDIDRVMKEWGMPMGPLTVADEVGLDIAAHVGRILNEAFSDRLVFPEWIDKSGADPKRLGAKTGSGFYKYEKGRRQGPDPEMYTALGLRPRVDSPDPGTLVDRMVLPMVNEAARCLEEGVVANPGELDLAMIMGTGFPPFRGGLCRWADAQGLGELIATMERLASSVGERFQPSAAVRAANESGGLYGHDWSR